MIYAVYIVECADGSLYTGIATDVQRRLLEHNGVAGRASAIRAGKANATTTGGTASATTTAGKASASNNRATRGKGARYTAARRPVVLVLEMPFETRSQAAKEEARIKRLSRDQKQLLIATMLSSQTVRA